LKIDVSGKIKIWLGISAVVVSIALGALLFKGLNFGLDFTGGNLYQVKFEKTMDLKAVNTLLDGMVKEFPQLDANSRKVQIVTDDSSVIIRTPEMSEQEKKAFIGKLKTAGGNYQLLRTEKVGASIGKELKTTAISALLIGSLLIVGYITIRFEFKFAIAAIIALLHDVIISVGGIALLGNEVNTPFIAAVLTILGYSINDTIVVFDRIREVIKRKKTKDLGEAINMSINQTLTRSLNTSVTTFLAVFAILIWGGASLKTFIVTLLIGVIAGTYSSIFVASPFVYLLDKNKKIEEIGHH